MTLIATVFSAMCCLLLAIITVITAIRSRRTTPKIVYSAVSVVLVGVMALLVIGALPKSSPTFVFSAAAPVPASLTMYFANNELGSGTMTHDDLHALRVTDGSTRFIRTYFTSSTTDITLDQINGGVLYIREFVNGNPTSSIVLKALRPNDGSEIWQKTFPNPMYTYLIKDGVIYVVSVDSNHLASIVALRASDGSVLWQHPLPYKGGNVVAEDNGMLYLSYAGDQHFLYVLRASDGKMLWQSSPLQFDIAQISVVAGIVYLIDGMNAEPQMLHALRATDGTPLWQIPAITSFHEVNGAIYTIQSSGALVVYRASDGKMLWQTTKNYFDAYRQNEVQIVDGVVYAIGSDSLTHVSGTLYAFRATNGVLLWSHAADYIGWFTVSNGMVYISGASAVSLAALHVQDGSVQWHYHAPNTDTTYGTPELVAGVIVVSSKEMKERCYLDCGEGNYLNVINAETGAICWRYKDLDISLIADIT